MTTTNSKKNTSNDKPSTLVSDTDFDALLVACKAVHAIVRTHNENTLGDLLAEGGKVNEEVLSASLVRAFKAIQRKIAARAHGATSALKTAILAQVAVKLTAATKARDTMLAMDPSVREALKLSVPESIQVPMSDLLAAFPTGTTPEQVTKIVHALGFKLVPGKKTTHLSIPLPKVESTSEDVGEECDDDAADSGEEAAQ